MSTIAQLKVLNALDQANPKTEHATSRHSPFKPLGLQGLEDLSV